MINVLSLFDGMSCGRIALERAGIKVDNYYSSEIDKYAIQIANKNYPQDEVNRLGDVTTIKASDLPKIDLLIGGSPCQSFSSFGNSTGFNGKSGLFWEFVRVLKETNPKYFLLENVNMKKEWQDIISKELGVFAVSFNSNLVSAQNRDRLYWTNINFKLPEDRNILFKDILEDIPFRNIPNCFYKTWGDKLRINKGLNWILNKKANCLTTKNCHPNQYLLNEDKTLCRLLSANEYEKLQTLPIDYTEGVSNSQRYKMIGNGWTISVISHILKGIK